MSWSKLVSRLSKTPKKTKDVLQKVVLPSQRSAPAFSPMLMSSRSVSSCQTFTILVEGNIGSGKTTFLDNFKDQEEDIEIFAEPVDRWRNVQGHNLLEMMYKDPERYSLLFQTYVQLTMLQQHTQPTTKPIKLMERSLARYCFIENLYSHGKMSPAEYAVISEWFNFLVTVPSLDFHIDLIVYLRTDPEVAYERIKARSRHEEVKIPFSYLEDLHQLHEDWLVSKTKFQPLPAPVLVIDANDDLSKLQPRYSKCKKEILEKAPKRILQRSDETK